MTNVRSYLDWQRKKAEIYAEGGFVPWENLIITYDNTDGIIDLRIVESEIINKLIISAQNDQKIIHFYATKKGKKAKKLSFPFFFIYNYLFLFNFFILFFNIF